jgi:hypothetical protein
MVPAYTILTLPIQKRSYESYYRSERKSLAAFERQMKDSDPKVSDEWIEREKSLRRWPAWALNDTIGFLKIGIGDGPSMLLGAIFLMRRCHRDLKLRHAGGSRQFLYWQETGWYFFNPDSSQSCVDAAKAMTREAQSCVRQFGRGCRRAVVREPSFGFDALNWSVAISNAMEQTD